MVSQKRRREFEKQEEAKKREAYEALQRQHAKIYHRIYDLEQAGDLANIGAEILKLLKYAQRETKAIHQSIKDKTDYYDLLWGEPEMVDGTDVATFLAEEIADLMRRNVTNPQTVWQALSEQFPKVHFTVDWFQAVSVLAMMFRQERLAGMIEGLKVAGVHIPKSDPDFD